MTFAATTLTRPIDITTCWDMEDYCAPAGPTDVHYSRITFREGDEEKTVKVPNTALLDMMRDMVHSRRTLVRVVGFTKDGHPYGLDFGLCPTGQWMVASFGKLSGGRMFQDQDGYYSKLLKAHVL